MRTADLSMDLVRDLSLSIRSAQDSDMVLDALESGLVETCVNLRTSSNVRWRLDLI
jgi:hypothetical protein